MTILTSRNVEHSSAVTRPRILYFTRIDLPSKKANSIQSMNTCYELARQGADVILVVRHLLGSRKECLDYYGLPETPRLRLLSLSIPVTSDFNAWKGPVFERYFRTLLKKYRTPWTVLMTRDPAGLELLQRHGNLLSELGITKLFEVHKISFLVKADHQAERGRDLDDPKVQRKIQARKALEADVYAQANGLVCTSNNAATFLGRHFDPVCPVSIIPNGTRLEHHDPECLASGPRREERDLDIIYVGQLYKWKGVDTLVQAMAHLPGRRLTIIGGQDDRDTERLRALARQNGVEDRIDMLGFKNPSQVTRYLSRARVGVVPSPRTGSVEAEYFTSPLKLFDFMRTGVAIVASDLPSVREIVRDGEHALLTPPEAPQHLARAIESLLQNPDTAARLVRKAAERVTQYSWSNRAQRLLQFLQGLSEGHLTAEGQA